MSTSAGPYPHDFDLTSKAGYLVENVQRALAFLEAEVKKNRQKATLVYIITMACSFGATVFLGLHPLTEIGWFKGVAFVCSAAVTFFNGIEPFFSFRGQSTDQQQAVSGLYRLRDELLFTLAGNDATKVPEQKLEEYLQRYKQIWTSLNQNALIHKKSDGDKPSPPPVTV
jgi:hypothetical protein